MVLKIDKTVMCEFDNALNYTGFGKYNLYMLGGCFLLILAMYLDIFGSSVVMPALACDLALNTHQQGLLAAVPLIGVMVSSYAWGLCADTLGRRFTLLAAMPVGAILNIAAAMAPTYTSLVVLKFWSACFTSSANAAAFVLVGESEPQRHRSRFMFLMASGTLLVQFFISLFALPILSLTFHITITWLQLEFRPWRLVMLVISLPGVLGVIAMVFLHESPKYLLSKGRDEEAVEVLKIMFSCNTGLKRESFPIAKVYLEEAQATVGKDMSFLSRMWNQTAPLFKPPLLKNSLKLYYLLLCAYMTSTGFTMWIPTMTNAYFSGDDRSGQTFCQVASTAAAMTSNTTSDCGDAVQRSTLYAIMAQSGVAGILNVLLSFVVGKVGKKKITLAVFAISASCGVMVIVAEVPIISIVMLYLFLYVSFILGNINTYLVELNPTYLRGMATCLSVVVARGFGFFSVQLITALMANHCTHMISGYVILVASGLVVSIFLPPDSTNCVQKRIEQKNTSV